MLFAFILLVWAVCAGVVIWAVTEPDLSLPSILVLSIWAPAIVTGYCLWWLYRQACDWFAAYDEYMRRIRG